MSRIRMLYDGISKAYNFFKTPYLKTKTALKQLQTTNYELLYTPLLFFNCIFTGSQWMIFCSK